MKASAKIHGLIRRCIGAEHAMSAIEIGRNVGIPDRTVRQIIAAHAREWPGILVCSIPGRGYFCAATYDEAEAYDNWLADLATEATRKRDTFRALCRRMGFAFAKGGKAK